LIHFYKRRAGCSKENVSKISLEIAGDLARILSVIRRDDPFVKK